MNSQYQQRSAELGAKIRAEDGLGCALQIIEQTVQTYRN
jgi:hypothetical protein